MKTVRLKEPLEARLQQAARLTGKRESQIIREALESHCATLLEHRPSRQLAGLLGVVDSSTVGSTVDSSATPALSDLAENTGTAFGDLLLHAHLHSDVHRHSHDAD